MLAAGFIGRLVQRLSYSHFNGTCTAQVPLLYVKFTLTDKQHEMSYIGKKCAKAHSYAYGLACT